MRRGGDLAAPKERGGGRSTSKANARTSTCTPITTALPQPTNLSALGTLATVIGASIGLSGGESKKPVTGTTPVPVKSDPSIKSDDKDELDL